MDARFVLLLVAAFSGTIQTCYAQGHPGGRMIGANLVRAESQNFVALAPNAQMAQEIAQTAEAYRNELANYWLGAALPPWSTKCPIVVVAGQNLPASGETTFTISNRSIVSWHMRVSGTYTRIKDSVLPHEITHTVLATHFAKLDKTVPRWADEGACTTVEHTEERSKNDRMLIEFLSTGRGIPFATLFALKEYPSDILPMYAQGYSLSMFLIGQGGDNGARKFIKFLEQGVSTENWVAALNTHYSYSQLGQLQMAWNQWVADGGGEVTRYTGVAIAQAGGNVALASAQTPAGASIEQVADIDSRGVRSAPAGRFAVAQNQPQSNSRSDGFEPVTAANSLTAAWQPRSGTIQSSSATEPAARLADNPGGPGNYQFQPVDAALHSRALPQPFQGIGSSPASIQFGPAEALVR